MARIIRAITPNITLTISAAFPSLIFQFPTVAYKKLNKKVRTHLKKKEKKRKEEKKEGRKKEGREKRKEEIKGRKKKGRKRKRKEG